MKILGSGLIFLSALHVFLQFRLQKLLELRLRKALLYDLAILKSGICVYRKTLPAICETDLKNGLASQYLWKPLAKFMAEGYIPVYECWSIAVKNLPSSLGERLNPLGLLLSEGREPLGRAIDEVREELLSDIHTEESKISVSLRLAGATCLSVASLLILLLI